MKRAETLQPVTVNQADVVINKEGIRFFFCKHDDAFFHIILKSGIKRAPADQIAVNIECLLPFFLRDRSSRPAVPDQALKRIPT